MTHFYFFQWSDERSELWMSVLGEREMCAFWFLGWLHQTASRLQGLNWAWVYVINDTSCSQPMAGECMLLSSLNGARYNHLVFFCSFFVLSRCSVENGLRVVIATVNPSLPKNIGNKARPLKSTTQRQLDIGRCLAINGPTINCSGCIQFCDISEIWFLLWLFDYVATYQGGIVLK